jgi:PKD repeat protein
VPLTVAFTDTSINTPTAWSWNFGDSGTSTAQHPSHIYNTAGTYSVTLTASNVFGSDPETKTNYITVNPPSPTPTPSPTVQVTVQTNTTGLAFSVDGSTYTSTQTFSWGRGSNHTIGTTFPQSGASGVRYVWSRWSDGGAIFHTVAPATDKTYTAIFRTQYYLTMTHGTGGNVSPASGWRNSGAAVSISAMPATGYHFTNWTGSGTGSYSGTNDPASITMNGPISETGTFTHN